MMRLYYLTLIGVSFLLAMASGCTRAKLPDGVTFRKTKVNFIDISWSPDGKRLVGSVLEYSLFGQAPTRIYMWDIDSDTYMLISVENGSFMSVYPAWRPNHDQILYRSSSDFGKDSVGILDLETMDREGLLGFDVSDWFPDGSQFVTENGNNLYIVDVSSNKYEEIWEEYTELSVGSLSVSPNGQQIGVILTRGRTKVRDKLLLVSLDGSAETQIFERDARLDHLDWSFNGEWLTLISVSEAKRDAIAVKADGSCVTDRLPVKENLEDISWSWNGDQISAALTGRDGGVYFIETQSEFIQNWLQSGSCS